jgi:hypothetical protein
MSLVAMIDVLMILLFFFMVTSTYLDLDMVPLVEGNGEDAPPPLFVADGHASTCFDARRISLRGERNWLLVVTPSATPPRSEQAAIRLSA